MRTLSIKYKGQTFDCLVDDEDFVELSKYRWTYRCGYASRNRQKADPPGNHWIHMHREVLAHQGQVVSDGLVVDHIDRNKLNNQRSNLRIVTRSVNGLNVSASVTSTRRLNASKMTELAASLPRTQKQSAKAAEVARAINKAGLNRHCGKDNHVSKRVIDAATGIVYDSIRQAAMILGLNYSTLKSKLNGSNPNNTTISFMD